MKRPLPALTIVVLLASAAAQAQQTVAVTSHGWTVTADPARSVLAIAHEGLGILLRDMHVALRGSGPVTGWVAERGHGDQLLIRSARPVAVWRFEPAAEMLRIASTSYDGELTALAPAPPTRIPVRLLDREGAAVVWQGNGEVGSSYGAKVEGIPSFLPRRNPECMYFSLGQVSNPLLHSLFDRPTGIAIDLPLDTRVERSKTDPDALAMTIPVEGSAAVRLYPEYFTKVLGLPFYVPFDDRVFSRAPMVWSSWTSYYEAVTEADMVRNTDWIAQNLEPYGFEYVELDDGYDRGAPVGHHWIENWSTTRFPHGPEWLASYIKSKGLSPGIWLVPNAYAGGASAHPDWYLRDKQGRFILDYHTPALDSTNPNAIDIVKRIFTTLDGWGFEYYKFDGEHALPKYVPAVDRDKLYDKETDFIVSYRRRLDRIREIIGPRRFVEGCPAGTPLNGIGFFNSYFPGTDLYANWEGMYPLFSAITSGAFLNHLLVYVMPGEGMELGPPMTVEEAAGKRPRQVLDTIRTRQSPLTGLGTTTPEARTVVSWVALTGVAYPLASVMPELPAGRVELLHKTLPTMPILPADLFSRGSDMEWDTFKHTTPDAYIHRYPEILDLKVNAPAGIYDVAAFTNWRSQPATRTVSLAGKLGLSDTNPYVVFDFWNQKLLGIFRKEITVTVEPHDTRVLLIHPLAGHPQLAGISRHITGAFSVERQQWDASRQCLGGISATVAGERYGLTVYVPPGYRFLRAEAARGGQSVPALTARSGNALTVSFPGGSGSVEWRIFFAR